MTDASPASPTPDPGGPPWVKEAAAAASEEVRCFARTAIGFMRRPGRFSAAWLDGRQKASNPLGFVATALGISGAAGALVPGHDVTSVLGAIALAVLPYCYYTAIGIVCHPLLRLGGSTRRLRASVAVALFAGGGPALLATLAWYLAFGLHAAFFGAQHALLRGMPPWAIAPMLLLVLGPFAYYLVALALGLAGLHAVGRARAVAFVLLSLCAIGLMLGALHRVAAFSIGVPTFVLSIQHHVLVPDLWL